MRDSRNSNLELPSNDVHFRNTNFCASCLGESPVELELTSIIMIIKPTLILWFLIYLL